MSDDSTLQDQNQGPEISFEDDGGDMIANVMPEASDDGSDDEAGAEPTGQVKEGDSATPTGDEGGSEKPKEVDPVQKAINKQHFKYQEQKRKTEAAEARLAELERKMQLQQQPRRRPIVPPIPDSLDPEYERKIQARDMAIADQKAFDLQVEFTQRQQQQRQQQEMQQHQERVQQQVQSFQQRATELKVNPETLVEHENIVGTFIQDPQVAGFLLEDKNGPLLVQYLAEHPEELSNIASLPTVSAVATIVRDVTPKVVSAPSSLTKTPAPSKNISGRGAADIKDPALDGLILE